MKKVTWNIPPGLFQTVYTMPLWQKVAVLVISWVLPLAIFYFVFLEPRLNELDRISGKIPKLKKEIAILEEKERKLPQLEAEIKKLDSILRKAIRLLPEKKDIPSVLTDISSLGNEARLDFPNFQPQGERLMDFYAEIPVNIELTGPFHNTMIFFDKVTRMPRIVHIKSVSMGNPREAKAVWSQRGEEGKKKAGGKAKASPAVAGTEAVGTEKVTPLSTWVVKTRCQAVTYRFLTPEEIAARKKKAKGRRRRR